jgi:hypothetical protein
MPLRKVDRMNAAQVHAHFAEVRWGSEGQQVMPWMRQHREALLDKDAQAVFGDIGNEVGGSQAAPENQ